jgi:DSBA-like thioredoxin domain
MATNFAVTYDYRCPFARNAHEHIVTALRAGADWDVDFVPFSLSQVHVEEGGLPVWEDPERAPDLLALEVSLVVADHFPSSFLDVHEALFAARHDEARDLRDRKVILDVLASCGIDVSKADAFLDQDEFREQLRRRHESFVDSHNVWGVPTFILGEQAAFVRLMTRPKGDTELARKTIERVMHQIAHHPEINEIKHTTVPN